MLMTMLITTEATIDCRLRPGGEVARWRVAAPTQVRVRCVAVVVRSACSAAGGRVTAATSRGDKAGDCETRRVGAGHVSCGGSAVSHTATALGRNVQNVDTAAF